MPSTVIHEEVGYYIGKKYNIDSYDYYLGLIAPDSPNLLRFAPKKERWIAHQRSNDYKEWRNNIKEFYLKEKDNYPKDFILGYFIHILTDIIFDEFFYEDLRNEIEKRGILHNDSHQIMSQDMQKYYFEELNKIVFILQDNKTYKILNISKNKMLKWKEKQFLLWHKRNDSIYITNTLIDELNKKVLDEFESLSLF